MAIFGAAGTKSGTKPAPIVARLQLLTQKSGFNLDPLWAPLAQEMMGGRGGSLVGIFKVYRTFVLAPLFD